MCLFNRFLVVRGVQSLKAQEIERGWNQYCRTKRIKARSLPTRGEGTYIKLYWEWIKTNHANAFRHWEHFFNAKSFARGMHVRGQMATYVDRCSKEADLANPGLNIEAILQVNKEILTFMTETFINTVPAKHLNIMILCLLRMAFPGPSRDDLGNDRLWIFSQTDTTGQKLRILKCPMGGSAVYVSETKKSKSMTAKKIQRERQRQIREGSETDFEEAKFENNKGGVCVWQEGKQGTTPASLEVRADHHGMCTVESRRAVDDNICV